MSSSIPTHDGMPVTSLFNEHVRLSARIVEFGGWLMPVQYDSILGEHNSVRTSVGAFDLSHMGRVFLRGPDARPLAQWVFVNDVDALMEGKAQYSLVCNPEGRILDDVIVYNLGDQLLVVFNASNRERMLGWLDNHREQRGLQVEIDDQTASIAMIGVQGPLSEEVVQGIVDVDVSNLPYYAIRRGQIDGTPGLIARTGYTGEDGFELMLDSSSAPALWRKLVESLGVKPCGLGARDTLRLEAGMPLYGHEIDESTTPYQAGLGRVVKLAKGEFVGRAALELAREEALPAKLAGFVMVEPGVARQGYEVQSQGSLVGRVTSGAPSPSLKQNIGMAYLEPDLAVPGGLIDVVVRGKPTRAEIVPVPFVPHHTKKIAAGGAR